MGTNTAAKIILASINCLYSQRNRFNARCELGGDIEAEHGLQLGMEQRPEAVKNMAIANLIVHSSRDLVLVALFDFSGLGFKVLFVGSRFMSWEFCLFKPRCSQSSESCYVWFLGGGF